MASYTWSSPIENPRANGSKEPLPEGEPSVLDYKQVPIWWFSGQNYQNLKWCERDLDLPANPDPLLFGSIRNRDIPYWGDAPNKQTSGYCRIPTVKSPGTLVAQQGEVKFQFGGPGANFKPDKGEIKWNIQCDSQLPSLTMDYKLGPNESEVVAHRVIFYGNKSMQSVSYYPPEALQAGVPGLDLPDHHKEAAARGCCMAISFNFGKRPTTIDEQKKNPERYLNSMLILHDGPNDRWKSPAAMLEAFNKHTKKEKALTGFDLMLYRMLRTEDISITFFREGPPAFAVHLQSWIPQYKYWLYVMDLSRKFGLFWWYAMQTNFKPHSPGAQLSAWDKPEVPPPVPFWLVQRFRAFVENGQLKKLEPMEWKPVVQDPALETQKESVLPHPDYAAFLNELSLLRERAFRQRAATILFDNDRRHNMSMRHLTSIGQHHFWRVELTLDANRAEGTQLPDGEKILPESGTLVRLTCYYGPGRSKKTEVRGRIVEAIDKPRSVDLVAHCTLSATADHDISQEGKDVKTDDGLVKWTMGVATVVVKVNFESINRAIEALRGTVANITNEELEKRMNRYGPRPDARHLLLKYLPRAPGEIRGLPDVKTRLGDFVAEVNFAERGSWNMAFNYFGFDSLENSQKNSIIAAIQCNKGNLTVIHGPPATGKSTTLACLIMMLHFVFKAKICMTTPSNTAADAIMKKVVEKYNQFHEKTGKSWELVRFLTLSGTPVQSDIRADVPETGFEFDTTGLDEVGLAQRELWKSESALAGYSFHERKKKFAKFFSERADVDEDLKKACEEWLKMIKQASQGLLFGDPGKIFKAADDRIGEEVLGRVDVLMGTLNSFGRGVAKKFRADTIIVDETHQATLPEIAIPFNTFEGAIRACTAGDHLQLKAFLASAMANETTPYTSKSSFREQHESKDQFAVHMLDVQYRCHPQIYHWSNKNYYGGLVSSASHLSNIEPIDKTVAAFMQRQIGHSKDSKGKLKWNPNEWPRVIAIDIHRASTLYPGSTSSQNLCEVEFLNWLRNALLKAEKPAGGSTILPGHLFQISPYRGQTQAIRDRMRQENAPASTVSTVAKAQGGEGVIGLSTFAKNDPEKPKSIGFVSDPPLLNVWFSRQQRFHFIVGNFVNRSQWTKEIARTKLMKDQRKYANLIDYLVGKDPNEERKGVTLLKPVDFIDFNWPAHMKDEPVASR